MDTENGTVERFLALSELYFKLTSVHQNMNEYPGNTDLQNAIRECTGNTDAEEQPFG